MMRRTLVATALGASLVATSPALAAEHPAPRTIALSGHGEVRVAPDMVTVISGVTTTAPTAAEALAANTAAMNKVFATLKEAGIEERDLQTANFSVSPRYDYNNATNGEAPKLVGYDASNTVMVTLRKLDQLGTLLDKLVSAGSNQINGVNFMVSKPDEALDEARRLAVADAAHKAKTYTDAMGVTLGPVINISEGTAFVPPIAMQMGAAKSFNAAPVPVAAGEQVIAIDVSVTWDIR